MLPWPLPSFCSAQPSVSRLGGVTPSHKGDWRRITLHHVSLPSQTPHESWYSRISTFPRLQAGRALPLWLSAISVHQGPYTSGLGPGREAQSVPLAWAAPTVWAWHGAKLLPMEYLIYSLQLYEAGTFHYPCFLDEETEAQTAEVPCLTSSS